MDECTTATGVCLQANLPICWEPDRQDGDAGCDMRRHANLALLRALAVMESAGPEREHDIPDAVQKSIDHLEAKLDLVLLLVAEMARSRAHLPEENPVTLFSERIVWQSKDAPAMGQELLLSLYLSPRLPQPLQLSARVENVEAQPEVNRISASFERLDDELAEWITRTIFRYHRRALQARRQP